MNFAHVPRTGESQAGGYAITGPEGLPALEAHAVLRARQRVSGDLILAVPQGDEAWFAAGDVLVPPTDGLVDQMNSTGNRFTNEGLADALRSAPSRAPREVAEHIFSEADAHAGGLRQGDDQSVAIVLLGD